LSGLQGKSGGSEPAPLEQSELPHFRATVDEFEMALAAHGVDFHSPPFTLPETVTARELADQITAFFYKIRDREGPILSLLWQQFSESFELPAELAPLREAGERIAADFDRGLGAGHKNAYHNRQHTVEVLSCAQVMALLDARSPKPLDAETRMTLLLAALIHDWHHDGGVNGEEYFRLEKIALRAAKPYFSALSLLQQQKIDLMVRTTDVSGPHQFARTALAYQRLCARMEAQDEPPPPPPAPEGMELLSTLMRPEHAQTVEAAAMLRDADILPSAGLTAEYAAVTDTRYHEERAEPYKPEHFAAFLNAVVSRPRTTYDSRPPLPDERPGLYFAFSSRPGQLFNDNIPDVVRGHAQLMEEMGEQPDPEAEQREAANEPVVDLSVFEEVKADAAQLGQVSSITLESIGKLRTALKDAGFLESPPFTLSLKHAEKIIPNARPELLARLNLSDQSADTLQRLHGVGGPLVSALVGHLFDSIGLRVDDAVYRAAAAIAKDIDSGIGVGTLDDNPANERNPYHNHFHIIDLLLVCDLLGQRATQRGAPASSPLARGLMLLGALICHWHHTGKGNKVDGVYKLFHLQDHALRHAAPHVTDMSKELRQSLEILVRATDPREPYIFSRAAYNFHVGLGPRPTLLAGCEPLARLLTDPALCTLTARLNDAIFVPFVGLGSAYSARSIVQMGREIGVPIDFTFVRKNLIAPMLTRPPYPGEKPPPAIVLGPQRIASFTSSEAQALFNSSMHALLVAQDRKPASPVPRPRVPAPSQPLGAEPPVAPTTLAPMTSEAAPAAPSSAAAIAPEIQPQTERPPETPPSRLQPEVEPASPTPADTVVDSIIAADEPIAELPLTEILAQTPPAPPPITPESTTPLSATPAAKADFFGHTEFELDSQDLPDSKPLSFGDILTPPPAADIAGAETSELPDFPQFRYHADPVASGVIRPSAQDCACCGRVRGFSYFGPVHDITMGERRVCPWCIADGSAHGKLGMTFADITPLRTAGVSEDIIREVVTRTPGYQSWQRDNWLVHCNDACVFAGDATSAEAQNIPAPVRKQMLDYYDLSEKAWPTFISNYRPGGDPGLYKFVCRQCGEIKYGWDCS